MEFSFSRLFDFWHATLETESRTPLYTFRHDFPNASRGAVVHHYSQLSQRFIKIGQAEQIFRQQLLAYSCLIKLLLSIVLAQLGQRWNLRQGTGVCC